MDWWSGSTTMGHAVGTGALDGLALAYHRALPATTGLSLNGMETSVQSLIPFFRGLALQKYTHITNSNRMDGSFTQICPTMAPALRHLYDLASS
ncbi:unnamed protein product [Clonostachys rosea]|uniref:Uncharacterized protein n=1 Tax=Bionectria ochroleuca TaxID=29856 RepID=A0ABY6UC70_BIOOC|nr:unnamed protein product [Clonostachys rosea]